MKMNHSLTGVQPFQSTDSPLRGKGIQAVHLIYFHTQQIQMELYTRTQIGKQLL